MFLLDTVTISELRKRRPSPLVVQWISQQSEEDLFLNVITVGEIQRGIAVKRKDDPEFAAELGAWLDALLTIYGDRILPLSAPIARRWGELSAATGNASADLLIAATAQHHRLIVVTRNTRHFEPLGVSVLNPFEKS